MTSMLRQSNLVGLNCALTLAASGGGRWQLLLQQLRGVANGATGNANMAHCQAGCSIEVPPVLIHILAGFTIRN